MDLDQDGNDDLYLWTNWTYYSHINYMSSDAGIQCYGKLEVSAVTEQPTWIEKHLAGDTIDHRLNWSSVNTSLMFSRYL